MKIVCLTPVKNEEWIIDFFLKNTSAWADKIILADQQSTDKTLEIAHKFKNVDIIYNKKDVYDEGYRQNLLLTHVRKSGKHILFALDADEILSPEFDKTDDWKKILTSPPKTAFFFQLINICPDLKHYWSPPIWFNMAYVDDGATHQGTKLHSPRFPRSSDTKNVYLDQIKVLHLQFIDWKRMSSKHRWYQCEELVNNPNRSTVSLYRQYHHMDISTNKLSVATPKLLPDPIKHDLCNVIVQSTRQGYYWDKLVAKLIAKHGERYFSKVFPHSLIQKVLHYYLRFTQRHYGSWFIAKLDNVLG